MVIGELMSRANRMTKITYFPFEFLKGMNKCKGRLCMQSLLSHKQMKNERGQKGSCWTHTQRNKIRYFSSLLIFSSFTCYIWVWLGKQKTLIRIFVNCFNYIIINRGLNDPFQFKFTKKAKWNKKKGEKSLMHTAKQ